MTKLEAYEAAETIFDAACREANNARAALSRSKSKANIARFIAANDAYEAALAACTVARDAHEAEVDAAAMMADIAAATTTEFQTAFAF